MKLLRHPLRLSVRLAGFVLIVASCLSEFVVRLWLTGQAANPRKRAEWLTRWSRRTLRLLGVHARYPGQPPAHGLLVSNHLSYLDILVISAHQPTIFVSKAEVRRWPVFGWLARSAGTIFVNRDRRTDVKRMGDEFAPVVESGLVLCLFPEGTSSDGQQVLRFHSSLFGPAEDHQWPVTPLCVSYHLQEGSVADEICYWRDMVLVPHLLNLFTKKDIQAVAAYGPPLAAGMDRKQMAHEAHARVTGLLQQPLRNHLISLR